MEVEGMREERVEGTVGVGGALGLVRSGRRSRSLVWASVQSRLSSMFWALSSWMEELAYSSSVRRVSRSQIRASISCWICSRRTCSAMVGGIAVFVAGNGFVVYYRLQILRVSLLSWVTWERSCKVLCGSIVRYRSLEAKDNSIVANMLKETTRTKRWFK